MSEVLSPVRQRADELFRELESRIGMNGICRIEMKIKISDSHSNLDSRTRVITEIMNDPMYAQLFRQEIDELIRATSEAIQEQDKH